MNMKEYKYPSWHRIFDFMPLIPLIFGILFCIDWFAMQFGLINATLFGDNATINYGIYLQGGLLMVFMGLFFLARNNEFRIENDGIHVSLFYLFWKFIPWEDVLEIRPLNLPGYPIAYAPWILKVKRMTMFHRIASISYLAGIDPIIVIAYTLNDFDGFINTIETKLKSRNA